MHRTLPVLALVIIWAGPVQGHGLLIPAEKSVPPLAMLNHQVTIAIEDQVAVTRVEQTFRNHTDRALEATYVFPVPKGAGVRKFTMWVDGKEVAGEMVEADKARQIYTEIVRRTQDPGLLEYLGNNLMRMRVFPVGAKSDQKVSLSYTSVAPRDATIVEYIYPLKTNGKATSTLEKFSISATIKSQHVVQNVYSPTHAVTLTRKTDHEVAVGFERDQALLDKDFQLFYAVGDKDVGLTAMTHRPISSENGFFMFLISPRIEMPKDYVVPRDMVFVIDTSGSMRGPKMEQAKKALKFCLANLDGKDRFAVINFATTINKYATSLVEANADQRTHAAKWVDNLETTGGTAINDALAAALDMRTSDDARSFTVVFFTDGQPTIGETNPDKILKNVSAKNTANTRIFTFGVGDDVNATMLDQLADQTRALSTYVRPAEDIAVKAGSLYSKISNPVLANLKLTVGDNNVSLVEIYPPQLPDLFHGGQLVVLGRYSGKGHVAITLSSTVGKEKKDFVYELSFPDKTSDDRSFVEHLWARRKVGYLLDQIRVNGEKKELVEETVMLAKKYGIATPYTSYLIVPDGAVPVVQTKPSGGGKPDVRFHLQQPQPEALQPKSSTSAPTKVIDFARQQGQGVAGGRGTFEDNRPMPTSGDADDKTVKALKEAKDLKAANVFARDALKRRDVNAYQAGGVGVNLSIMGNCYKWQSQLTQTAQRNVYNRNCVEIGGVWIDEAFDAKMQAVTVKAQSNAYFRMLEKKPELKDVFVLGNHLVWITPSNTALVIDSDDGKEELSDAEIDKLFVARK